MKKWGNELNRAFFLGQQMSTKAIKEMQIKTTLRLRLTPVTMATIKNIHNNSWQGYGEKRTLIYCWWECKLVQPLWKTVWRLLKKTKNKPAI
jgi:hypothetical protein